MTYAWIITHDGDLATWLGVPTRVGVAGPSSITQAQLEQLRAGQGHAFRMCDDDRDHCYEGLFLGDRKSEEAFGPLDDFGTPDAGFTYIEYLVHGQWEVL